MIIIICALLYALVVSVSVKASALMIAGLLPLYLVVKRPGILRNLVKFNAFNLVMIITLALTWSNFREGFIMGVIIALRFNMIYIIFSSLIFSHGESKLYEALAELRFPEKLRVLFLLTFRGINIMKERLDAALVSLRLRAPELSVMMRLRTFAYITASVLLQSDSRSQRMTRAIICRGGFGGFNQTESRSVNLHDMINLAGFAVYSFAIVILNHV